MFKHSLFIHISFKIVFSRLLAINNVIMPYFIFCHLSPFVICGQSNIPYGFSFGCFQIAITSPFIWHDVTQHCFPWCYEMYSFWFISLSFCSNKYYCKQRSSCYFYLTLFFVFWLFLFSIFWNDWYTYLKKSFQIYIKLIHIKSFSRYVQMYSSF